jgi:hypothetical protein
MLDHVFRRPSVRDRIRANPLGKWLPDYVAYLVARGHPPQLIQEYGRSVEHFGCWLASEHLVIDALTRLAALACGAVPEHSAAMH